MVMVIRITVMNVMVVVSVSHSDLILVGRLGISSVIMGVRANGNVFAVFVLDVIVSMDLS